MPETPSRLLILPHCPALCPASLFYLLPLLSFRYICLYINHLMNSRIRCASTELCHRSVFPPLPSSPPYLACYHGSQAPEWHSKDSRNICLPFSLHSVAGIHHLPLTSSIHALGHTQTPTLHTYERVQRSLDLLADASGDEINAITINVVQSWKCGYEERVRYTACRLVREPSEVLQPGFKSPPPSRSTTSQSISLYCTRIE